MREKLKEAIRLIDEISKKKLIKVISHYDTDGITSAAIFTRALERWNKKFSLQIVKGLDEQFIETLPEDQILIFLDLASGSLDYLGEKKTEVIILDHHEIVQSIPSNVFMVNPLLENHEMVSGAGICYLFAKTLSEHNKDLAHLAVIGMVGDILEKNIGRVYDEILKDAETLIKKGLLIYPSSRPLDRALEYSSNPYIPGVTGNYKGVCEVLRDANIPRIEGRYKALCELTEEEMGNLITAIMLHGVDEKAIHNLIGNLYLIRLFNKQEDAREFSALINACSRMNYPYVSLAFCLGNKKYREEAEKIYYEYKQNLVSALKYVSESEKISGKNYTIINARNNIKDTIIGTVASIISRSPTYTEGTIIVALAYNENKIKVSARMTGSGTRNVREVLHKAIVEIGGEVGGHPNAAGCLIAKEQENRFIEELKKVLEPTLPTISN
ncbi:MAG: DHH family phosphoesterase [Nanoarchaeota archaeon]